MNFSQYDRKDEMTGTNRSQDNMNISQYDRGG